MMRKLLAVLVSATLVGCASAHGRDRLNDFADIAAASVDRGFGIEASVGPASAGAGAFTNSAIAARAGASVQDGFDSSATFLLGFGCGPALLHIERFAPEGTIFPDEETATLFLRNKFACSERGFQAYQYGRIRLRAALILGFSIELNWLEAIDFFAGWLQFDPLADDRYVIYERLAREQ
ncbi:MAG: hypothetical protein H7A21_16670 [Spirochaetales bacterium]|nr:hypothetical protein [Spirochaetales bacterium]MCP5486120.1 hypothetical protein [Spirochaetales bacterium]